MKIEEAIRILHPDTSAEAIAELKYYSGFNQEKVVEIINEAIKAVCDELKKLPKLSEDGTLTVTVPDGKRVTRVLVWGENHHGDIFYPDDDKYAWHTDPNDLPELNVPVLVADKNGRVCIRALQRKQPPWWSQGKMNIIAWREIEPFEGGE